MRKSTFVKKKYFHLGIFFVLPCIEKYTKVDLRTSVIDIPPQEVCDQKVKTKNKFFWVLEKLSDVMSQSLTVSIDIKSFLFEKQRTLWMKWNQRYIALIHKIRLFDVDQPNYTSRK